jgi:ATP-dependent protease HslVU (ClpYQ), ATPase subunit
VDIKNAAESAAADRIEALTPRQIVAELDKFIVGQAKAKRAVAVALRNRYRRARLAEDLRDEVIPKNILMIGPTGVGKTEIARRLAKLAQAPFLKVEATKFTEVGYVGRDVDSMVRDLVQTSLRLVEGEMLERVKDRAEQMAVDRIVDILVPRRSKVAEAAHQAGRTMQDQLAEFQQQMSRLFGGYTPTPTPPGSVPNAMPYGGSGSRPGYGGTPVGGASTAPSESEEQEKKRQEQEERVRQQMRQQVANGLRDTDEIEIEVEETNTASIPLFGAPGGPGGMEEMGQEISNLFGQMMPKRKKKRRVTIKEARELLTNEIARGLIDQDAVQREAVKRAEESGIIFLDELDKVAGRGNSGGPDVSREGVQRDLLPIIEGSTVQTKYGPVRTNHVLFIAAGAFHVARPSDLIPELQGRLPIRVELESLTEDDFRRILSEPKNALTKQYAALLATEGVSVEFTDEGVREIARIAVDVNTRTENIGARRLHTLMERLLEDLSFDAPDVAQEAVTVDAAFVRERLADIAKDEDLSRYIL